MRTPIQCHPPEIGQSLELGLQGRIHLRLPNDSMRGELFAFRLARTPKLEAPDRLEHWPLKASRSLGGIVEDAAAADREALNSQASAPLKHLELRNSGLTMQPLRTGKPCGTKHDAIFIPFHSRFEDDGELAAGDQGSTGSRTLRTRTRRPLNCCWYSRIFST